MKYHSLCHILTPKKKEKKKSDKQNGGKSKENQALLGTQLKQILYTA